MLDLKGLKITLDFLCLTFRSDLEELVPGPHNHRTTSFCSSSSGVLDANNPCATLASQSELSEDEDAIPMDEDDRTESISRQLLHIPEGQKRPIKAALAEIEWMLRDEIVAFMLDSFPMLESTLLAVCLVLFASTGQLDSIFPLFVSRWSNTFNHHNTVLPVAARSFRYTSF